MTFSPELENIKRLVVKMNGMMRLPESLSWSLKRDIKLWQSCRESDIFQYCCGGGVEIGISFSKKVFLYLLKLEMCYFRGPAMTQ